MPAFRISAEAALCLSDHSYANYHADGLTYLCLHRSHMLTLKLYLFEGSAAGKPAVSPHDHAYDFETYVLTGRLLNTLYDVRDAPPCKTAPEYGRYNWRSLLVGGSGAEYAGRSWLTLGSATFYGDGRGDGRHFREDSWQTHTVTASDGTFALQLQLADYDLSHTLLYVQGAGAESAPPCRSRELYGPLSFERSVMVLERLRRRLGRERRADWSQLERVLAAAGCHESLLAENGLVDASGRLCVGNYFYGGNGYV